MTKLNLSRENIYFGKVAYALEGNILKTRNIIFGTEESLDLENSHMMACITDINYETPNYPYVNLTNTTISQIGLLFGSIVWMGPLLNYFGFDKFIDEMVCQEMMMSLFNGMFPYDYCELFGVKRKINSYWHNGSPSKKLERAGKYTFSNYEIIDNRCPIVNYFETLALNINALCPEKDFMPLEEEGNIRKRILK